MRILAGAALRYHAGIEPADLSWTLVEATDRIPPEPHGNPGRRNTDALGMRAVDVRFGTC
ncbi:hypothetical protein SAMN05421874_111214 [Nonomuraea maritima]|uniref:Uncharacterized protein n=2 Tax=Nonomuraea maritima TaxID=683260 RepID=A0A1G9F280_9ACTN|nr:hypothetical protein [Nonomuraea maritima]SDK82482.1 hypothetical protein SAMN05421874_111214 [Nonomuraea maritima]